MQAILAAVLIRSLVLPNPDLVCLIRIGDHQSKVHALLGPPIEWSRWGGRDYWMDRFDRHTIDYDSDSTVSDIDSKMNRVVPWPTVRR